MTSGTSSLVTISPSSDIVSLYLQNLYTPVTSITKIRLSFSGFNFYTGTTLLIDDIPNNNFTLDNGNPNIVDVNSAGGAPIVTSTSILTFTFPFNISAIGSVSITHTQNSSSIRITISAASIPTPGLEYSETFFSKKLVFPSSEIKSMKSNGFVDL